MAAGLRLLLAGAVSLALPGRAVGERYGSLAHHLAAVRDISSVAGPRSNSDRSGGSRAGQRPAGNGDVSNGGHGGQPSTSDRSGGSRVERQAQAKAASAKTARAVRSAVAERAESAEEWDPRLRTVAARGAVGLAAVLCGFLQGSGYAIGDLVRRPALMRRMDFDRNGRVDLYEFTRAARTWDAEAETSSWMKVFGKGDKNKDGKLSSRELMKMQAFGVIPASFAKEGRVVHHVLHEQDVRLARGVAQTLFNVLQQNYKQVPDPSRLANIIRQFVYDNMQTMGPERIHVVLVRLEETFDKIPRFMKKKEARIEIERVRAVINSAVMNEFRMMTDVEIKPRVVTPYDQRRLVVFDTRSNSFAGSGNGEEVSFREVPDAELLFGSMLGEFSTTRNRLGFARSIHDFATWNAAKGKDYVHMSLVKLETLFAETDLVSRLAVSPEEADVLRVYVRGVVMKEVMAMPDPLALPASSPDIPRFGGDGESRFEVRVFPAGTVDLEEWGRDDEVYEPRGEADEGEEDDAGEEEEEEEVEEEEEETPVDDGEEHGEEEQHGEEEGEHGEEHSEEDAERDSEQGSDRDAEHQGHERQEDAVEALEADQADAAAKAEDAEATTEGTEEVVGAESEDVPQQVESPVLEADLQPMSPAHPRRRPLGTRR